MFVLQGPTDFSPYKLFSPCLFKCLLLQELFYMDMYGYEMLEVEGKKRGRGRKINCFFFFLITGSLFMHLHTYKGRCCILILQ